MRSLWKPWACVANLCRSLIHARGNYARASQDTDWAIIPQVFTAILTTSNRPRLIYNSTAVNGGQFRIWRTITWVHFGYIQEHWQPTGPVHPTSLLFCLSHGRVFPRLSMSGTNVPLGPDRVGHFQLEWVSECKLPSLKDYESIQVRLA